MVMGPEQPGPKIDCNVNCRPVLSSERAPHFRVKTISDHKKERENLVMGLKKKARLQETLAD
jgi:hypothetical protein